MRVVWVPWLHAEGCFSDFAPDLEKTRCNSQSNLKHLQTDFLDKLRFRVPCCHFHEPMPAVPAHHVFRRNLPKQIGPVHFGAVPWVCLWVCPSNWLCSVAFWPMYPPEIRIALIALIRLRIIPLTFVNLKLMKVSRELSG